MATTTYQIVKYWAGHSNLGGSNKNWAGCLIHAVTEEEVSPGEDDTPIWGYLAVYGKSGSNYVGGKPNPELRTKKEEEADFDAAVKQKAGAAKGYIEIAGSQAGPQRFSEFLPFFKIPLLMPTAALHGTEAVLTAHLVSMPTPKRRLAYIPCGVKMLKLERLQECLADDTHYGISEKVNGVRCLILFDGETLTAYNRNGEQLAAAPEVAEALKKLGCPFLTDGEQLTGRYAGYYIIFELVTWNNEDVGKTGMFQQRNSMFEEAMKAAGLINAGGTTQREALENSLVQGLALLTVTSSSQEARLVFAEIESQKGEGVVVRQLAAFYGGPRSVQKYKFYPTLDAIAIGIRRKGKIGSVKLGLVRERDGAIIEIGHVRSGLNNEDVASVDEEIKKGSYPVFEVAFLLDSTINITLVQASTNLKLRRTDKKPQDCTTQQLIELLGEDRAVLINTANAIPNLRFV